MAFGPIIGAVVGFVMVFQNHDKLGPYWPLFPFAEPVKLGERGATAEGDENQI